MATANFQTQKQFNLYATKMTYMDGDPEDEDEFAEEVFDDWLYMETANYIDDLNEQLEFFEITLADGYYDGVQTLVKEKDIRCDWFDMDASYILDCYDSVDGAAIHRNFGVNKYILKRKILAEIDKINNIFLPKLKRFGFAQYGVSARFSNGETWYTKI
jgi:hypothetical protein